MWDPFGNWMGNVHFEGSGCFRLGDLLQKASLFQAPARTEGVSRRTGIFVQALERCTIVVVGRCF